MAVAQGDRAVGGGPIVKTHGTLKELFPTLSEASGFLCFFRSRLRDRERGAAAPVNAFLGVRFRRSGDGLIGKDWRLNILRETGGASDAKGNGGQETHAKSNHAIVPLSEAGTKEREFGVFATNRSGRLDKLKPLGRLMRHVRRAQNSFLVRTRRLLNGNSAPATRRS
ncbi:hypothetical protein [Methylocapsa sp. S129]|uniref:hypothetical protein n=1 Tax=Methylocapsa sp. S129 TaxID=1641869 RepID=UPI00131C900C|nr:hypothetical protein [Methylocapsa sp. S129]